MSYILLGKRNLVMQVLITVAAIGTGLALRILVSDQLPEGFPFLTFFPAVLVTAVFASVRAGLLAAIICGLLAWYYFIPPFFTLGTDSTSLVAMGFYTLFTLTELFFIAVAKLALQRAEEDRRRATDLARSRDLMFSELQHRVSNNLSTMGALLRMQSARVESPEARQALLDAMQRLQTVARIQRSLYLPDGQQIEVKAFLCQLSSDVVEAFASETEAQISVEAEPIHLHSEQSIPFGLIASEMLVNALEHAQPDEGQLHVTIACRGVREPGSPLQWVSLTVTDNGHGLTHREPVSNSLGVGIARQFAAGLQGRLTLSNRHDAPGAIAELRFPLVNP